MMHNTGQQYSDFTIIVQLNTKASEICVFKQKVFWMIVNYVRDINILNQAGHDLMHLDLIE